MVTRASRARLFSSPSAGMETHLGTITVQPNAMLSLRWLVGNSGGADGQAQASISIFGVGLVAAGNQPMIPAGAGVEIPGGMAAPLVEVRVSFLNTLGPGTYQGIARLMDVTPGAPADALNDGHDITILVPAPIVLKEKLFIVSGPTIV